MAFSVWRCVFLISTIITSCLPLPTMSPLQEPSTTDEIPASAEDVKTTELIPTTTLDYDLMDFDEFIAGTGSLSDFGPAYTNTATNVDSNMDAANVSVNVDAIIGDKTGNDPDYDYDINNNSTSHVVTGADTSLGVTDVNTNNEQANANGSHQIPRRSGYGIEATDLTENNNYLSANNDIYTASNQSTDAQNADGNAPTSGEQNEAFAGETTTVATEVGNNDATMDGASAEIMTHSETIETKSNVADHNATSKNSAISTADGTDGQSGKEQHENNGASVNSDASSNSKSQVDTSNTEEPSLNSKQQSGDSGDGSDDSISETQHEDISDSQSNNADESRSYVDKSGVSTQTSENTNVNVESTSNPDFDIMRHSTKSMEIYNTRVSHSAESGHTSNSSPKVSGNNNERSDKSVTATDTDSAESTESDTLTRSSYATSAEQQDPPGVTSTKERSSSMDHCFGHSGNGRSDSKFCELARTVRMICTTIFPDDCFKSGPGSQSVSSADSSYDRSNDSPGIEILSNSLDNIGSSRSSVSDIREVIMIIKGVCPSLCSLGDTHIGDDSDESDDDSADMDSESTDESTDEDDDSHQEMEDHTSRESQDDKTIDMSRPSEETKGHMRTSAEDSSPGVRSRYGQDKTGKTSLESVDNVRGSYPESNEHDELDRSREISDEAKPRVKTTETSKLGTETNNANQPANAGTISQESLSENDNESK